MNMYIYIYIYIPICVYVYIYIYIYIPRTRDAELKCKARDLATYRGVLVQRSKQCFERNVLRTLPPLVVGKETPGGPRHRPHKHNKQTTITTNTQLCIYTHTHENEHVGRTEGIIPTLSYPIL